ncbi:MAG: hypothetical protein AAB922_02985 [Patescibacteria group bacterium]|mgnify:CR=1 FL=1
MKDKLSKLVAEMLPNRVMLWCIVRAFAWTTTHECSHKTPDDTGYSEVYKSWEARVKKNV